MASKDVIEFLAGAPVVLWLVIFGVGPLIERLCPARKGQPCWKSMTLNLKHALVLTGVNFALLPTAVAASAMTINALRGGLIALPGEGWSLLWAIPLYLLAMELADYLFHRAQHAWSFLWAMHSLHHSDSSVDLTTSFRHFWTESLIRVIFVYPFVHIILIPSPVIFTIYTIAIYWGYLDHMNIRISFGRCRMILTSPQYHRIHHAATYVDRNFAAIFPIYDIIFGTYYRPEKNEYPPSGLESGEEPNNLLNAVLWPFVRHMRGR